MIHIEEEPIMPIKMIRDCGSFKKHHIYEIAPKKAMALLTNGFCVRACEDTKRHHHKQATKKAAHHKAIKADKAKPAALHHASKANDIQ